MSKCYKCGIEIKSYWNKCSNCETLLLCPQCDNTLTGNWKRCPNCSVDLDFGRIRKIRALGYSFGIGIAFPLVFIIIGFFFPVIEMFSFHQFSFSELFLNFLSNSIPFIVWTLTYSLANFWAGVECIHYGKRQFREYGITFFIETIFGIVSLFMIRIYGVFMIGLIIFLSLHILGLIDILHKYNKIKKNRPKYLKELEKKEEKARIITSEAKKSLLGMIKGEGKVNLDFASQIINMDQNTIKRLIYDLIAEDKVEGTFQENEFLINSDVQDFIDDLLNKFNEWEKDEIAKKK